MAPLLGGRRPSALVVVGAITCDHWRPIASRITFQLEYELTADAIDLGLDATLPPVIDLASQIA